MTTTEYKDKFYDITVITPAYMASEEQLMRALRSLQQQTIGFENIEWIVVNHNSTMENRTMMKGCLSGFDNVRYFELDNDKHSASCGRNFGLPLAKGEYIGFLDADDCYHLDTLKIAVDAIRETKAQIASFRFEMDSGDAVIKAIQPYVLIPQTDPIVVVERKNWDSRNFIYGSGLAVTSKIYERKFLEQHTLRFDEDVPLAEDNLFNLMCFDRCERICFLPQLIGYLYYLNNGSMVQSFSKTTKDVFRYAEGIRRVLDQGLKSGFYMTNVTWDLLGYQAAIMLASTQLKYPEYLKICEEMRPYLDQAGELKVSKLYSKGMAKLIMSMPRIVYKHPRFMAGYAALMRGLHIDVGSKIRV